MVTREQFKESFRRFLATWSDDYAFKTYITSGFAFLVGLGFILYSGFMGIYYRSLWYGSICFYYILLAAARGLIITSQMDEKARALGAAKRKRVLLISHIIIFIMDLSLIAPIKAMIDGIRAYNLGLIPAIVMAAYTTYRIVMSIRNLLKARRQDDTLVKVLRTIFLMDTLFAILILQNTLIITVDGEITGPMKALSIASSTLICMAIYAISILSFVNCKKAEGL